MNGKFLKMCIPEICFFYLLASGMTESSPWYWILFGNYINSKFGKSWAIDFCYEEIEFHLLVLEDFPPTPMDAFKLSFLFSLIFGNFLMMNFGGVIFHSSFWAFDKLFKARKSFKKIKYLFDNNFFFLFSLILFLELHL